MKILCVAEKPSIAKSVANTLGGDRVSIRPSRNKFIKNYDFNFDFPQWGWCDVTFTSVAGHITQIDFPKNCSWGSCLPNKLFEADIITYTSKSATDIANNIGNEARNSDILMIWTDCDREGEYIGYEIVQAANKTNPRMTVDSAFRAHFSFLERSHISHAARNPTKLDKKAIAAVQTRTELDLRTGASFTRFLTDLFKNEFRRELDSKTVISYGGCQFPTLGFVVDRYKRIKAFKEEKFWYIGIDIRKGNIKTTFSWERPNIFDPLTAFCFFKNAYSEAGEEGEIINIEEKSTSNWAPLPLTTVELQKDCARYFKMSAKEALDTAEKLYNQGFLSYPRTETDIFPKGMDLKKLIEKQSQSQIWGSYASNLLNDNKFRQPREGKHDDKAHPPIHPIIWTDMGNFNDKEKKIYEYVTRRFLACCSKDATGSKTTVKLKWGPELFNATGLTVLEENYLEVYPYQQWKSSKKLPQLTPNQKVKLSRAELMEGKTKPPSLMTETELIALMDINGIGTDATIADHIEKILARQYIIKESRGTGKNKVIELIPTELGMGLVEGFRDIGLDNISLTKPFLRKNLEEKLVSICEGKTNKDTVCYEMITLYREAFALSNQNQRKIVDTYRKIVTANTN
ncbi:DNA topoisomerase activity protein [[Candida] boidinii]|nr:DNA topoisomerase activity protein [[Candida] boidinii]OWB60240.1 DNA topoisomerase activity protein [[Candida] boidinii]OWB77300.1 DNA topoisomerase activity protein [[Candida] boidinii]